MDHSTAPFNHFQRTGEPSLDAVTGTTTADVSFGIRLRELRQRIAQKQASLSFHIGCTDAAISLWELSVRLPRRRTLARILAGMSAAGATQLEIHLLESAWFTETRRRCMNRIAGVATPCCHPPRPAASANLAGVVPSNRLK
jgi:hypothetical protein